MENPAAAADADQRAREDLAKVRGRIRAIAVVPLAAGVLAGAIALVRRALRR
jgi:hypothetical protein